jgi:hypothetical protein
VKQLRQTLTDLLAPPEVHRWISLLPAVEAIRNLASKLRLIERATDVEVLRDYLCELRFALIFRSLGFDVEADPMGKKGPDFRVVRDGKDAMLECTRLRRIYPGPPELGVTDPLPTLGDYGDPRRDTKKAFSKITSKFPQVTGFDSIVAVWNDDGDLEEFEVGEAVGHIRNDVTAGRYPLPLGLQAVLYSSPWRDVTTRKQNFCFELVPPGRPASEWFEELRGLVVEEALARLVTESAP